MLSRAGLSLLIAGIAAGSMLVGLASPAAAVTVSNEAELRAAFATDTQIDVQADIVLTDCTGGGAIERTAAVTDPVTVDGHGHTVRQTCADNVFLQDGSGLFTARNLTITGGHVGQRRRDLRSRAAHGAEHDDLRQSRRCRRRGYRRAGFDHDDELGGRFERQQ